MAEPTIPANLTALPNQTVLFDARSLAGASTSWQIVGQPAAASIDAVDESGLLARFTAQRAGHFVVKLTSSKATPGGPATG